MLSDGALAKVLARVPISIARKKTLGKLVKENGSGCVAKCSVKKITHEDDWCTCAEGENSERERYTMFGFQK